MESDKLASVPPSRPDDPDTDTPLSPSPSTPNIRRMNEQPLSQRKSPHRSPSRSPSKDISEQKVGKSSSSPQEASPAHSLSEMRGRSIATEDQHADPVDKKTLAPSSHNAVDPKGTPKESRRTRHAATVPQKDNVYDYISDDARTRHAVPLPQTDDVHDYISDDARTRHAASLPDNHRIENITAAEQLQEEIENLLDDRKFKAYRRDLRKRVSGKPTRSSSVISVPSALLSGVKKTIFAVFIIFLVVIFFFLSCG